ncbi:glycosyl hydrolase family 28-related protein [Oleiharenicola lentus]|uniref:glycosyl hydrolase family 28-related protein n=1 Tax=Oleiharenicola lentus TaxID=2508720 RepID=UPI003F67EB37
MKMSLLRFVAATCLALAGTLVSRAVIETHPLPPIVEYAASSTYALTVDGINVQVTSFGGGYDYAHFTRVSGSMNLQVKTLYGAISQWAISPAKLPIAATKSGNTLSFSLSQEQYLIVATDGRRLVIAIDPPYTKPASSGAGIRNVVTGYGANNQGVGFATAAIQAAINDTHNAGGGIVYVPAGRYYVGNLTLKSNVHLFMEGGAVFRFHGTSANYTHDAFKTSQNRWLTWWIKTTVGSTNVKIYGRGTLDANATNTIGPNNFACNVVVPLGTANFTMEGIVVRDAGTWSVIPARSNNCTFRNVKMFNSMNLLENDGIDVNESQNIVIDRCLAIAHDDAFSSKTWAGTGITVNWPGSPEPVDDVLITNCLAWSDFYAYKIGEGTNQPQNNVRFVNNVAFDCAIGIGISAKWGSAPVTNTRFEGIDIERVNGNSWGNSAWWHGWIQNVDGTGGANITGVYIKNIKVRDAGNTAAALEGLNSASRIDTVTFENVVMPGQTTRATTLSQMNVTSVQFATNITVR